MLRQANEHFKVVAPFFSSLSPNQACAITPIKYFASTILTSSHAMDTALSPALCEKLRHRLNSLKMFTFWVIIFHMVWYPECLCISRN